MRQLCRAEWLPQERKNYGVRFNVVDVGRHEFKKRNTENAQTVQVPPFDNSLQHGSPIIALNEVKQNVSATKQLWPNLSSTAHFPAN